MPSFTVQLSNLQAVGPVVEIQVAVSGALEAALRKSGTVIPDPIQVTAMIDTGATRSVLQQGIARQLGLNPIGVVSVHTPSSTHVPSSQYAVRLLLPNSITIDVPVLEMPLQGQHIQCLIGRDVLAHATLVYLGRDNLFSISF